MNRVFRALGERVEQAFRAAGERREAFPAIAEEALGSVQLPDSLDYREVARWALDPATPPQAAGATFGDLSLVVYEAEQFVVQLLVWVDGVADIHQHAFSGAFRVLEGSSVHGCYALSTREQVGPHCRLVDAELTALELLRSGDVRAIHAGDGLTHGLFHLDVPSVSVVVRTRTEPMAEPPFLLIPPRLALASFALDEDPRAGFLIKNLYVLQRMRSPEFLPVLIERCRELSFAQICQVVRRAYPVIGSRIDPLVEALQSVHGPIARELHALMDELERLDALKRMRHQTSDADDRLLLAGLLFGRSRAQLEHLLRAKHPGVDPAATLARFRESLPPRLVPMWRALT
jgi:hypothetical protein